MSNVPVRKNTCRLLELVDEGFVDPIYALEAALGYMSDDDVADMARANDIELEETS